MSGNGTIRDIGNASIFGVATARAGNDTWDLNGFNLTWDQDSRYGIGGGTGLSVGGITVNSTKGGVMTFDARYIRLIPFTGGSGSITANASVSASGATGNVIGIYSAVNTAPVLTGVTSGFLKITNWNGVSFPTSGSLTVGGWSCTINGADTAGWMEIVGEETGLMTCNRLGQFLVRGAWYEFAGATTSGTRTTSYQVPSNGSNVYCPGAYVQSALATITGATFANGKVTYTTSGAHGFREGEDVTVEGITPSGWNCTDLEITDITSTTFSVVKANPGSAYTSGGSAYTYEFYPTAGSMTALVANINTDAYRGKYCWITTAGLLYFGYDGTNQTGGYLPPSGRKIRVQNIFFTNCTAASRTTNALPNATLGTRMEFATSGGGVVDMDKVSCGWYLNIVQSYQCNFSHVSTFEAIILQECAAAITWNYVNVGQGGTANTQIALTATLNFAGGTMRNCKFTRIAQAASGTYVTSWADCTGFTIKNIWIQSLTKAANATSGSATMTRVNNSTITGAVLGGGRAFVIGCDTLTWKNTNYYDHPATTTGTTIPMYVFDLGTAASKKLKFDGLTWCGLTLVQAYSGVLNIGVAGCSDIKLRNLGTAAAPLDMGGAYVDATWTRATTTMTITKTAHGLKAGDLIAVNVTSDASPKAVTTTTATLWTVASAPTADTFTVTVTNAGQTAGQFLSYYPCMSGVLVNFVANSAANPVSIQRCYTPHLRTGVISTQDNTIKNVKMEDVWGTEWGVMSVPMLNCNIRRLQSTPGYSAQTATYGTHWMDNYITADPANKSAVSWARTTTTCAVTSNGHGLRVGDKVLVTVSSDTAAVVLGVKTIIANATGASPANPANVFSFTCLNAGSASGTLTFVPLTGRVAIQMNEASAETTGQVTLSGGAAFTSAGTLYMPNVGQYAIFTSPFKLKGHASFPINQATMGGGTIGNYNSSYSVDGGTTWWNLNYPRAGGGGSSASTNVTMTSTTGVAVGDYVFGTGIAPNAKVTSITNATTVVVDIANTGTVSGVLTFNHLPSETIADPTVGINFKIKIETATANTNAITYLYVDSYSGSSARAAIDDLDTNTLQLTGLVSGSDIVVLAAGTTTERVNVDANSGSTYNYIFSTAEPIDIGVFKAGYVPFYIRNYSLAANDATLPVAQVADRNYVA